MKTKTVPYQQPKHTDASVLGARHLWRGLTGCRHLLASVLTPALRDSLQANHTKKQRIYEDEPMQEEENK